MISTSQPKNSNHPERAGIESRTQSGREMIRTKRPWKMIAELKTAIILRGPESDYGRRAVVRRFVKAALEDDCGTRNRRKK